MANRKYASGRVARLAAGMAFIMFAFYPLIGKGHSLPYDLSSLSRTDVWLIYTELGFKHIVAWDGIDHILFVLGLFLLNPSLKAVITQATAFTAAHSITLGLATQGFIDPPASVVEPIIALSIAFVAAENLMTTTLKPWRIGVVFLFGLIHGMGFARALQELELPQTDFLTSLLLFNVGVEVGQITIILGAWLLVGRWFSRKSWYRGRVVVPASSLIALTAVVWTIERVFF